MTYMEWFQIFFGGRSIRSLGHIGVALAVSIVLPVGWGQLTGYDAGTVNIIAGALAGTGCLVFLANILIIRTSRKGSGERRRIYK